MYTANDAREDTSSNIERVLDERIRSAVEEAKNYGQRASIRVYIDDPFVHSIKEELEKRGFVNVDVPDICLKGDVFFEW